jgi:hypothetical protein
MRQSAVGQKCPDCAKTPRGARALGKPSHYVRAIGAGLGLAVVGGLVLVELLSVIRFGTIILSALLGYGVGRAVSWGAQRQSQPPFPAIAAACAVIGLLTAFTVAWGGLGHLQSPWLLLGYAAVGFFAVRGLHS